MSAGVPALMAPGIAKAKAAGAPFVDIFNVVKNPPAGPRRADRPARADGGLPAGRMDRPEHGGQGRADHRVQLAAVLRSPGGRRRVPAGDQGRRSEIPDRQHDAVAGDRHRLCGRGAADGGAVPQVPAGEVHLRPVGVVGGDVRAGRAGERAEGRHRARHRRRLLPAADPEGRKLRRDRARHDRSTAGSRWTRSCAR